MASAPHPTPLERWDRFGLRLAWETSLQSKDPSTKVGSYIADELRRPVSFGFNGFPRRIRDDNRLDDRETKYRMIIHAEANAIFNANRDLEGCTIFTYPFPPCAQCASFLIQKGIARVVAPRNDNERWIADFALAASLFSEAGVRMILVEPHEVFDILSLPTGSVPLL